MPSPSAASLDELLASLTPPQLEAATHVEGPLLVLAGPGSGKTRVITARVANLLRVGAARPWEVLAVTFTNRAAREMKERVANLVGVVATRIALTTFHSYCARTLFRYGREIGLKPGFSIYDSSDQQRAAKHALEEIEVSAKNFPPGKMLHEVSDAKNRLVDAEAYAQGASDFFSKTVAKFYRRYEEVLRRNNALDFDDLLVMTLRLLREREDVRTRLQDRHRFVLVDEYQDTNHPQFLIAGLLAHRHGNIGVTGDPDQSIYAWRGADIRNILEFETHFPQAKVVRLEQNYRSTGRVLAVADRLIRSNGRRKHKGLWTQNEAGEPVLVLKCRDERHEADTVTQWLRSMRDEKGLRWGQTAVFYRANALSRVMEDTLRRESIPYQIARGTSFYDRKEIKDSVAMLRAVVNPSDEVSLLRVLNTPARGISDTTAKALQSHALAQGLTAGDVLEDPAALAPLNARAAQAVKRFAGQLASWRVLAELDPAHPAGEVDPDAPRSLRGLVERVLRESGLEAHYRNDSAGEGEDRLANLGELVTAAQEFDEGFDAAQADAESDPFDAAELVEVGTSLRDRLLGFLERISLVSDIDGLAQGEGSVTLMTLHAAKGLEFPAVAIIGVEDGLLPHVNSSRDPAGVEEERRLCFVGITRAMRFLLMTHARFRTVFGEVSPAIPSRFLRELDGPEVVHEEPHDPAATDSQAFIRKGSAEPDEWSAQREAARNKAMEYPPGSLVRHASFGVGRVLSVQAVGAQSRAMVRFDAGVKNLVLEYAKLERIGT